MRASLIRIVAFLTVTLAFGPAARAADIAHKFLAVDNKLNNLVYVDQGDPKNNWTTAIPRGSRDLQIIEGEKVLVSHGNGAGEYDLATGKKLWAIDSFRGINSARRLPDGNTILGGHGSGGICIYTVDRKGKKLGELVLKGLRDLRLMRRLKNGNILLTVSGPYRVIEVDPKGKIVWQARIPGKGYKAVRLPSGNTLVSTAGAVIIVELDANGKTVSSVGGKKAHPKLLLDCFSGFDTLKNGNVVVANWLGHGNAGKGYHLIEFDRKNNVVWTWGDHKAAEQVTNMLLLDEVKRSTPSPRPLAPGGDNSAAATRDSVVTRQDKAAGANEAKALKEFLDRVQRVTRGKGWFNRKRHTRNPAGHITGLRLKEAKLEKNDFVVIGALQHLKTLDLARTKVTNDDLKHLVGLKNLRVLELDWNRGVGDAGVAHLRKLTDLETLDLRLTKVTGKGLGALVGLEDLRRLDVSDTPVDDVGLKHISQLDRLEVLNIGGTKITDKGLHHLKGLKHLRGLTLNGTGITNEGLNYLAKFPRFVWISSPVSTAQEFVRRLEKGDFSAVKYMYSPGLFMPHRGKMTNTTLDDLPLNAKDRTLNRLRFRVEMHWTVPAERIDTTLFATFSVDHGAVAVHEVGIDR